MMTVRMLLLGVALCCVTAGTHAHGTISNPQPASGPPMSGPTQSPSGPGGAPASHKKAATSGASSPSTAQAGDSKGRANGAGATGAGAISGSAMSTNAWELWWDHNKDPFVMRRTTARRTSSGSSGALTSRGRRSAAGNEDLELLRAQIIAAMQQVLQQETDPELCDSATLALARVSAENLAESVDPDLRKGLLHDTLSVRTSATLSLGVLGARRSLPLLNSLMADTSAGRAAMGGGSVPWSVRAYAALSLGLINAPLAIEPLLDVARSAPASEREVRATAVTALGLMQCDDAAQVVTGLLSIVSDEKIDPVVRACAVTSLGRLGDIAALPALLKAFRDDATEQVVRQSLAQALGILGSLRQTEPAASLVACVKKESDATTRQFAWIALGRLGARDGGPDLSQPRDNLVTLMRNGLLNPEHSADVSWAALAAGLFGAGQPAAAPALLAPLTRVYTGASDPSTRSACAVALGLCGADSMADLLLKDLVESTDASVRGYAAVSLGLLGETQAASAMVDLCKDRSISDTVRQQAASAIAMIGDASAAPALLAELTESKSLEYASSMSRALGQLRDPRMIGPLIALAQDPGARVVARSFACVALGLVGDKLDLRFNTRIEQDYNYLAGVATIDEIVSL